MLDYTIWMTGFSSPISLQLEDETLLKDWHRWLDGGKARGQQRLTSIQDESKAVEAGAAFLPEAIIGMIARKSKDV